ncbi:MAG: hypothetical protein AB8B95_12555 [Pseudohongiellaceae bacterium]
MFSKIIITLLVIVTAFTVIRSRNEAKSSPNGSKASAAGDRKKSPPSELSTDLKIGAYLFLLLSIGIGGSVYYFQWKEDHTVVTVNLYRDNQVNPVSYQVYKYQLEDKAFVTIDGLSVAVAGSERMEVLGLTQ